MWNFLTKKNKGITLIEVMVSLFIVSMAFTGLAQAFPFGLAINREAENATIAYYLAQEKLEELYSLDYDGAQVGTIEPKARLSADPDDYRYVYQRETIINYVDGNIAFSDIDTNLKKISVTIYYPDGLGKNEKSYNITALISKK